jgi:hypothetical protein
VEPERRQAEAERDSRLQHRQVGVPAEAAEVVEVAFTTTTNCYYISSINISWIMDQRQPPPPLERLAY